MYLTGTVYVGALQLSVSVAQSWTHPAPLAGGDASIFEIGSPLVEDEGSAAEPLPKAPRRMNSDINRTGAKPLPEGPGDPMEPGVAYHTRGILRTKPGRGPKSHSMSCSDKLARWSITGEAGCDVEKLHFGWLSNPSLHI